MLDQIQSLVKSELDQLNALLKSELDSKIPLLNVITDYVLKTKGKQIRPIIVLLTAKIFGETTRSTIIAGTMIELLHTATLVHDDVVDESETRRGFASIFAKWKTKTAVLLGDFMLSRGLLVSIENNEIELLRMMSESVKEMSEGELLQLEKSKRLNIDEKKYFEIISKKTATLIKTSCKAGCYSVTRESPMVDLAAEMGYHIGMAFQIKDDLLDLSLNDIGKPRTNDIRESKMTLPLIYTLGKVSAYERIKIKGNMRLRSTNNNAIQYIVDTIHNNGGIDYSVQTMNDHADAARNILSKFPQNQYNQAMRDIIDFTINRKY
jgi:octaprenyl-diphosphate synthase